MRHSYYDKPTRKWPYVVSGLVFMAIVGYVMYMDEFHPSECVDERVVVNITGVDYRSATIIDQNGETFIVNEGTFEQGGTVCVKYERR